MHLNMMTKESAYSRAGRQRVLVLCFHRWWPAHAFTFRLPSVEISVCWQVDRTSTTIVRQVIDLCTSEDYLKMTTKEFTYARVGSSVRILGLFRVGVIMWRCSYIRIGCWGYRHPRYHRHQGKRDLGVVCFVGGQQEQAVQSEEKIGPTQHCLRQYCFDFFQRPT